MLRSSVHPMSIENQTTGIVDVETIQKKTSSTWNSSIKFVQKDTENNVTVDEVDYMRSPFYVAFSPLLSNLKLCGMLYSKITKNTDNNDVWFNISRVYCWVITIICWLMVIRSFASLRLMTSVDPVALFNMNICCFLCLTAMNATTFLKASHDSKSLRKFFLGFVKLNNYGGTFICLKRARRIVFIATIICWTGIVINMFIVIILTFKTTTLDILSSDPFLEHGSLSQLAAKITFIFITLFLSAVWIFPSATEFCISIILYKEFILFYKSFSSKMNKDGKFIGSLENERCRYVAMCHIIGAADDALALHHGASFSCNIISICLLLYSLLYFPSVLHDPALITAYAFWLLSGVIDMSVVCFCGILINTAVGLSS